MGFGELLTVRSLFPFTKGGVRIDDGWDQLNRIHMFGLMVLMGTIVTVRGFMGNIIKCYGFQTFGGDFAEDYCWTQGLYTIRQAYDLSTLNVPYPGIMPEEMPLCVDGAPLANGETLKCPELQPPTRIYHLWYQWIPFYFFLVALAYYLPYVFFKTFGLGEVKKVVETVHMAIDDEEGMDKTENKIVHWLHYTFRTYMDESWITKVTQRHKIAAILFFTKVLYFGLSICAFWMTAQMFEIGNFLTYGSDWTLSHSYNATTLVKDKIFPKMVACEIKRWGPTGLEEEQGMCVLAPNVVNQYLFLILWFCMVFLIFTNALSVLVYAVVWAPVGICMPQMAYHKFANAALMKPNTPFLRDVFMSVGGSGRVILHIIANNTKPKVFENIMRKLHDKLDPYRGTGPKSKLNGLVEEVHV